jgi:hypothetical protein
MRSGQRIHMLIRESAISPISGDYDQISIRADHSKLIKSKSTADEHYQRVSKKLQEVIERQGIIKNSARARGEKIPSKMAVRHILTYIIFRLTASEIQGRTKGS